MPHRLGGWIWHPRALHRSGRGCVLGRAADHSQRDWEVVERPDLAERSIFSTCEPIDPKDRKSEDEIWASFHAAHASILGALLDAVATGLRRFPTMARPKDLPRMADFAHWAIACESALWPQHTFINAYNANILAAVESVLEASPVAVALRKLMENLVSTKWEGTATRLLEDLTCLVSERTAHSESWPGSGRALSGRLRRAASFLRRVGVAIAFKRDPGGQARRARPYARPRRKL